MACEALPARKRKRSVECEALPEPAPKRPAGMVDEPHAEPPTEPRMTVAEYMRLVNELASVNEVDVRTLTPRNVRCVRQFLDQTKGEYRYTIQVLLEHPDALLDLDMNPPPDGAPAEPTAEPRMTVAEYMRLVNELSSVNEVELRTLTPRNVRCVRQFLEQTRGMSRYTISVLLEHPNALLDLDMSSPNPPAEPPA